MGYSRKWKPSAAQRAAFADKEQLRNQKWEDCPREDLNMIPEMMAANWEPCFHASDKRYERISPHHVPHNAVSFTRGALHTWLGGRTFSNGYSMHWIVAELQGGRWCNHRTYSTLKDVLKNEDKLL